MFTATLHLSTPNTSHTSRPQTLKSLYSIFALNVLSVDLFFGGLMVRVALTNRHNCINILDWLKDAPTERVPPSFRLADDRLQFVAMRDPRAAAVSTFFHEALHPSPEQKVTIGFDANTLDEFVLEMVPVLCQWVALRYLLFTAILGGQSTIFWYHDALLDAHRWHSDWIASVGLHLPETVVDEMADAALREDFNFETKGKNEHPGASQKPAWHDPLRPETLVALDVIVRKWLPPVVLAKLDI